ncbi:MAG TPA: SLC13 family permease, partial [Gemmatimonadales bacterium]|nr:SLC13 family permease [Gemmatimonadales bacterium]
MRFPHPLLLLCGCVLLAAAASHVLPAGEYDRRDDPVTGRRVVVVGTYHGVPARPVGPFQAIVAIPRGMVDAAAVIFFVFLIGGAFTVVDETGALRGGVDWLVRRFGRSELLVIPVASLAFALGGVLDNMKEEIIALVPVTLLLVRRLGYQPAVAVAMSLGAAAVGASFSPINPFQVGIAQQLAQLPLLSGSWFRIAVLFVALVIWILGTLRYAVRTR